LILVSFLGKNRTEPNLLTPSSIPLDLWPVLHCGLGKILFDVKIILGQKQFKFIGSIDDLKKIKRIESNPI